jgi:tellurite resistance protein TerC
MNQTTLWVGFNLFVLVMLVLDLGVFHRKSAIISIKNALLWTCVWVFMAFLFNVLSSF